MKLGLYKGKLLNRRILDCEHIDIHSLFPKIFPTYQCSVWGQSRVQKRAFHAVSVIHSMAHTRPLMCHGEAFLAARLCFAASTFVLSGMWITHSGLTEKKVVFFFWPNSDSTTTIHVEWLRSNHEKVLLCSSIQLCRCERSRKVLRSNKRRKRKV